MASCSACPSHAVCDIHRKSVCRDKLRERMSAAARAFRPGPGDWLHRGLLLGSGRRVGAASCERRGRLIYCPLRGPVDGVGSAWAEPVPLLFDGVGGNLGEKGLRPFSLGEEALEPVRER